MAEDQWLKGSLVRIKLKNFVTYDAVEFKTGPHLNIVIGPNGTGKSSIVCALCLGLGGRTNLLGRAREIGEFIKHGEERAIIELELYNNQGPNYIIKRTIDRDANRSTWFINGKTTTNKEVSTLTKKLNIDVDNLCQFLPQDMVADFAKMTSSQLLEATEKATGGQGLLDLHRKLIELKNEHNEISTSQADKEDHLDKLCKRNDYLKDIVSKYEERNKHLRKIEALEMKRPWMVYEMERLKFLQMRTKKEDLERRVGELEEAAAPLKEAVCTAKSQLVEADSNNKAVIEVLNATNTKIKQIDNSLNKRKEKIVEIQEDMRSKEAEETGRQAKIKQTECEIKAYQDELSEINQSAGSNNIKEQATKMGVEIREIGKELNRVENQKSDMMIAENARKGRRTRIEGQMQRLNDVRNRRLENLRRYEKDTFTAVEWLRNNRNKFSGEVLEPMQLTINVPNPQNAKFIEAVISRNDRKAFIFEKKDDLYAFTREMDSQRLKVNALLAPGEREVNMNHAIDLRELEEFGFIGYLSDLIEVPILAKRYLCKYSRINNIPVGTSRTDQMTERVNAKLPQGLYFTPKNRCSNQKSRYGGGTISSINTISEAKIFNMTVDMGQITSLQNELREVNQETEQCQAQFNELRAREQELKSKDSKLKEDRAALGQQLQRKRTIEDRISSRQHRISELRMGGNSLETERQKAKAAIKNEFLKSVKQQREVYSFYKTFEQKLDEKMVTTSVKITSLVAVQQSEDTLQSSTRELQQCKDEQGTHRDEMTEQRNFARSQLAIAKRLCGLTESDLPPKFKRLFKMYPCATVDELDRQLNETKALAECSNEADPQIVDEYNKRKEEIETYSSAVENNAVKLTSLDTKIMELRERWYEPIVEMTGKINQKFKTFFGALNCAGEVMLSEHEDYNKWGIDIKVQFRNSDDLKRLTSSYQSGGEKSVSTILYLLSLQGLTECPFRVVDEINQGMDPKNERKVFELMAAAATTEGTSQYFLITPKLLPDLDYNDKMTIHSIYNGQGLESTGEESFNVETVIEQHRIRCSQMV